MKFLRYFCCLLFFQTLSGQEANFTATIVAGRSIQFYDASHSDTVITSWNWDFGDGSTATEQNPVHEFQSDGTFTICLTVNGGTKTCKENVFHITENRLRIQFDDTQWPNGDITKLSSPFGPRIKDSESRYDFHRGIDIPGNIGDPIVNIADGIVRQAAVEDDPENNFSSTVVVIEHQMDTPILFQEVLISKYYSISSHLNSIAAGIAQGLEVKQGQPIGTIGESGETNFPHNHFEIRLGLICSRESQRNGGCSQSNPFPQPTDPHVNPLLFLDYRAFNKDALTYEVLEENPLTIKVVSDRPELDFNELLVSKDSEIIKINFDERSGIDMNDIDNPEFNGVRISPARYTSSGEENYEITFTLLDLDAFDQIQVSDIWGQTTTVDTEPEPEIPEEKSSILPYPNPTQDVLNFNDTELSGIYWVFDTSGQLILRGGLASEINLEQLASGLYYLRIKTEPNGELKFYKILKQ
ncbi:MAG: PKD domain-containing protein [Bacteroidota bacterium]